MKRTSHKKITTKSTAEVIEESNQRNPRKKIKKPDTIKIGPFDTGKKPKDFKMTFKD
jgi:hypothetical protein